MNGFYKEAVKWRSFSPIDFKHLIKSWKIAKFKLKGCSHITIKIVRANKTTNSGKLVFQIDGYELPSGDF